MNLPGVVTELPALSEKDKEDIRFGVEHDIDMVGAVHSLIMIICTSVLYSDHYMIICIS